MIPRLLAILAACCAVAFLLAGRLRPPLAARVRWACAILAACCAVAFLFVNGNLSLRVVRDDGARHQTARTEQVESLRRGLDRLRSAAMRLGCPGESEFVRALDRFLQDSGDRPPGGIARAEDALVSSACIQLAIWWSAPEDFPERGVLPYLKDEGDGDRLARHARDLATAGRVDRLRAQAQGFDELLTEVRNLDRDRPLLLIGPVEGARVVYQELDELAHKNAGADDPPGRMPPWFPALSDWEGKRLRDLDGVLQGPLRRFAPRGDFPSLYDGPNGPFRAWAVPSADALARLKARVDEDRKSVEAQLGAPGSDLRPAAEFRDLPRDEIRARMSARFRVVKGLLDLLAR